MRVQTLLLLAASGVLLATAEARADATCSSPTAKDPSDNVRVTSLSTVMPGDAKSVSDGTGGAIMAWVDLRNGDSDIYAQHLLPSGLVDPSWPAAGVPVCTAVHSQQDVRVVSDGGGGAFLAWSDCRAGSEVDPCDAVEIFVHHLLANGHLDFGWPLNGVLIASGTGPGLGTDGAGGAIVAFTAADAHVHAEHLIPSGIDSQWPQGGATLSQAAGTEGRPLLVPDGYGGAVIVWENDRSGQIDIFAQHVLATGQLDAAWPPDGVAACQAPGLQQDIVISSDGHGGAFVAWSDPRSGTSTDIFAQHLLLGGRDPAWPADGKVICNAAGNQGGTAITEDLQGGAVVAWVDLRLGNGQSVIYAAHILSSGALDPGWAPNGVAVTSAGGRSGPNLAPDGAGGFVVAWTDFRRCGSGGSCNSDSADIYMQHVCKAGSVDGTWPPDGFAVSVAPGEQSGPAIVAGATQWLVTWSDSRSGGRDLYSQRFLKSTFLGVPGALKGSLSMAPSGGNPTFSGVVGVRVTLPDMQRGILKAFDLAGRQVDTRDATIPAGTSELIFEHGFAPGVYLVKLQLSRATLTTRVVVLRR